MLFMIETPAITVFKKGLKDLMNLCETLEDKFVAARDDFDGNQPEREEAQLQTQQDTDGDTEMS